MNSSKPHTHGFREVTRLSSRGVGPKPAGTLRSVHVLALVCLCALALPYLAAASAASATSASEPVVVLDTYGFWRMHHTLKPPVVDADGALKPLIRGVEWLDSETPPPPAQWRDPDFDDSGWLRTMAHGGCRTPYLARQCLRGKFLVSDPALVEGLSLSLEYHGGAAVYLNGREVGRGHLSPGDPDAVVLAEPYPLDVYLDARGDLIADSGTYIAKGRKAGKPDADSQRRMAARVRNLQVAIPSSALRQGVNVLAIEIVRAAYHKVMLESADEAGGKRRLNKYDWCTCELQSVRLTAARADGLTPNSTRPDGFQVWNSNMLAGDCDGDFGDPCETLQPISLVGVKNGSFTGKVVAGSTRPITGLQVAAGELRGSAGAIPASCVRIRYGRYWGTETGMARSGAAGRSPYPRGGALFGAVLESPPSEVPVASTRPPLVAGAVVPIWVTVDVPDDASPGTYSGQLTIKAQGENPVAVPIRLQVIDWALPDPQDYRTWVELVQVPDTLTIEYGERLWSDRLFQMIAESFRLISDIGTRVVYVPLIAHTNLGNAESMVRWVKTGEGQYEWDFSAMDRYLDIAQENLGRPKIVVLQVWEVYMSSKKSVGRRFGLELDKRLEVSQGGPLVTVLDRSTGTTQNVAMPPLTDPWSKSVWTELVNEVRRRLRERGIEDALMLGMFTDALPTKEDIEFFHEIAPDLPWVQQGHGRWTKKVYDIAEVGYQATVWGGFQFADGLRQTNQKNAPIMQSLYGWKCPRLDVVFERNTSLDTYPATRWLFFPETGITGELRGIGRIGADYWRAVKDKRGRRVGWAHNRFQEGQWGGSSINLSLCNPVLGAGPDGPVATNRLIALKEGVQACEARIFIEDALTDPAKRARLGEALAGRAQQVLDRRLADMWKTLSNYQLGGPMFFGATAWRWTGGISGHRWFLGSEPQHYARDLYTVAAEVSARLQAP